MDISISFKDRVMRNAFIKGLQQAGYSYRDYYETGILSDLHLTSPGHPSLLLEHRQQIGSHKENELLCKKYRRLQTLTTA